MKGYFFGDRILQKTPYYTGNILSKPGKMRINELMAV